MAGGGKEIPAIGEVLKVKDYGDTVTWLPSSLTEVNFLLTKDS